MSTTNLEVMCPKCGSPQTEIFWDKVKIEMSLCICCECGVSGMLNEFEYEIEN